MFLLYKRKGVWVAIILIVSGVVVLSQQSVLPEGNQYFAPVVLLMSAVLNFIFVKLFLRNERPLTEDEFQIIVEEQKERLSKEEFSPLTIKIMRATWNPNSSLFYVPSATWTYIFAIAAVILFIGFSFF